VKFTLHKSTPPGQQPIPAPAAKGVTMDRLSAVEKKSSPNLLESGNGGVQVSKSDSKDYNKKVMSVHHHKNSP
jgi:hypothetical protein